MRRTAALGLVLVAAVSGGLLIGRTYGDTTTATSVKPSATEPGLDRELIGYWEVEDDGGVRLNLLYPGRWRARTRSWGWWEGQGTYHLSGDTITWLGGNDCAAGDRGFYTYSVQEGRLTQTVTKDPCDGRRESFDGVVFTRAASNPPDEILTLDEVEMRLAEAGIATHSVGYTSEDRAELVYCDEPVPGYATPVGTERTSYAAAVVFIDGVGLVFDDPDLDLHKASAVLGSPVTPFSEYCDASARAWRRARAFVTLG